MAACSSTPLPQRTRIAPLSIDPVRRLQDCACHRYTWIHPRQYQIPVEARPPPCGGAQSGYRSLALATPLVAQWIGFAHALLADTARLLAAAALGSPDVVADLISVLREFS